MKFRSKAEENAKNRSKRVRLMWTFCERWEKKKTKFIMDCTSTLNIVRIVLFCHLKKNKLHVKVDIMTDNNVVFFCFFVFVLFCSMPFPLCCVLQALWSWKYFFSLYRLLWLAWIHNFSIFINHLTFENVFVLSIFLLDMMMMMICLCIHFMPLP